MMTVFLQEEEVDANTHTLELLMSSRTAEAVRYLQRDDEHVDMP